MNSEEDVGVCANTSNVEEDVGVNAVVFGIEEEVKTGISTLDVGICRSSSLRKWLTYANFIYILVFRGKTSCDWVYTDLA